jgi:hypothetical protein
VPVREGGGADAARVVVAAHAGVQKSSGTSWLAATERLDISAPSRQSWRARRPAVVPDETMAAHHPALSGKLSIKTKTEESAEVFDNGAPPPLLPRGVRSIGRSVGVRSIGPAQR